MSNLPISIDCPLCGDPECSKHSTPADVLRAHAPVLWRELQPSPPYDRNLDELRRAYLEHLPCIVELAGKINSEFTRNGKRCLVEILEAVSASLDESDGRKRDMDDLIATAMDRGELPKGNIAHEAVIEFVRGWPKKDSHTHISGSIPEELVLQELMEGGKDPAFCRRVLRTVVEQVAHSASEKKRKRLLRLYDVLLESNNFSNIDESEFLGVFHAGGIQRWMRDIWIDSASAQVRAIVRVAAQNFADGVTHPELRMNPFKSFGDGLPSTGQIRSFMKDLHSQLESLERFANSAFPDRCHQVSFLFSIGRKHLEKEKYITNKWSERFKLLGELMTAESCFQHRLHGVDIAGGERISWNKTKEMMIEDTKTHFNLGRLAKDLQDHVRSKGKDISIHLGDFDGHGDVGNDEKESERIEAHLAFCEAHFEALADGHGGFVFNRIGHGKILTPRGVRLRTERGIWWIVSSSVQERTKQLLESATQAKITIESTHHGRLISELRDSYPLYCWLGCAEDAFPIDVVFGSDNLYGSGPTTLSRWLTRVMLAAPCKGGQNLTVEQIQDMVKP